MKLVALLEATTKYFADKNIESPRLTTELILAEVLQKTRLQLYLDFELELSPEVLDRLRPLVKKRSEGYPLAQVLEMTTFAGNRYKVSPEVLIPRPETELLLEAVVAKVQAGADPIVDVGTGSGILACELARRFPALTVIGLDISEAALNMARENAQHLPNVTFYCSDLLASLPTAQAQIMVANLPYIPTDIIPTLSREVRHDPILALDGGADGLDLIRRLIVESRRKTNWLALEIGDGQVDVVGAILVENGYVLSETIKDLTGKERHIMAQFQN
jgi:release factor glutamine methyltransferase